MADDLTTPICSVEWADKFFSEFVYNETWISATPEKKISALKSATHFIGLYTTFYTPDGKPFYYSGDDNSTFGSDVPKLLKEACALEASYLLGLDDNPAEPHPLTVLGMISADGKHFDKDFTPPIFPGNVVKLLSRLGAEVDSEAAGSGEIQTAMTQTVC